MFTPSRQTAAASRATLRSRGVADRALSRRSLTSATSRLDCCALRSVLREGTG